MTTEPRAALDRLIAALEAHLQAASRRRGETDPAVVAAFDTLADAFSAYDEALFTAFDETTPFVLYDEDDDEDDYDDDEDDDDDSDVVDEADDLDTDEDSDDDIDDESDDESDDAAGDDTDTDAGDGELALRLRLDAGTAAAGNHHPA